MEGKNSREEVGGLKHVEKERNIILKEVEIKEKNSDQIMINTKHLCNSF